jgi:hypothetical protein
MNSDTEGDYRTLSFLQEGVLKHQTILYAPVIKVRYFATARVTSHRGGDPNAETCRCENLTSARVVVS